MWDKKNIETIQSGKWAVVNTHPHKESLALQNLAQQDFQTYCPFIRKRIRHARQTKDVLRPLFPSYIFVRINQDAQRWRPILSTLGVRALVRFGDRVGFLNDDFVESLKAREIDGALVRPEKPFSPGEQVRISGGAFDGLVATILEMNEKDRLVLLLDMLNRPVKVATQACNVSAA